MPAYTYVAITHSGAEEKGVLEADSEREIRSLLREKGLLPVKVHLAQQKFKSTSKLFSRGNSLSAKELALITRQLATLLSAGLPVEEALGAVAEQTEKGKIKGLILSVRSKVVEGHALADALRDYPFAFSQLYISTVAAGEQTGHLDKVLLRLADYTEQQWHLKQKLKTALIYPTMIVLVAIGIVGFLLEYVVPKMVAVYANLGQSLPDITKVLISISNFVQSYGFYVVILLIVGVFSWRQLLKRNSQLREKSHFFLLKTPLIGKALKTANTARFSRTLSILSASGVEVLEAMRIASQLITTIPIAKAVSESVNRVREGAAIHLALKNTRYFSPMSIHMIASGEASGQLESMLERVAINQENEIEKMIEVTLAMFEPAIILIMGAIVLFIVLAVMLPIFELNQFTG